MFLIALNCGSSSIKSAVFEGMELRRVLDLRIEQIGTGQARLRSGGSTRPIQAPDVQAAMAELLQAIAAHIDLGAVDAVAHRIVHGGRHFNRPTRIDDQVLERLEKLGGLAPLHNPPAIVAVHAARARFDSAAHFAVFDTSFHSTLPPRAREYALPAPLRERYGIRRYGFHGISHQHVMQAAAAHLHATPRDLRIISCHLGNGCSIAAIEYGRSVETSMGMTPLEGLVMGSRAGDIDPGILLELMRDHDRDALEGLLTHGSGLVGMTGTNDMREIEQRAADGDESCRLALNVYAHRVRKYIGAYAAAMGGVDVIAFTGGVGENSAAVRHRCLQRLDFLGASLDEDRNRDALRDPAQSCADLSASYSRVRLLALRADEERAMAEVVSALLAETRATSADRRIPVAVSARHAHLSKKTLQALFGPDFELMPRKALSQPGQFAAEETVTLVGPRGKLENVRLMGPPREVDQIEISRSDEYVLGVDAPVRISGDLANTPGITVEGPRGRVQLASGLITARRHIHMSPRDAERFGVRDYDVVDVRIDGAERSLTFNDVMVRVDPSYALELHLDTDEANAAGVSQGDTAEIVK